MFWFFFKADDYDVIDVDINHPERNREVVIVKFTDVAMEGKLHNGFDILIPAVDMRDYLTDKFKLEIVSDNELLLTMPSMHAWNIADSDKFFAHLKDVKELCPRTKQGHDVFRNALRSNKNRLSKYLLLRFPGDIVLSTQHYSDHKSELHCKIVPLMDVSFHWKKVGKSVTQTANVVYWKVSIKEDHERVVDKKVEDETETKGEKELSKLLASMCL